MLLFTEIKKYTYPTNWFDSSLLKKIMYDAIFTNLIWELVTLVFKTYCEVSCVEKSTLILLSLVVIGCFGKLWGHT